jgi:Tol biopolymer transport system component/tRNA A-37 threonylcarbamoyl transferase component Bud32
MASDPTLTRLAAALADRYRVERKLGEGAMASVYLAEDLKHGRSVALKVLKPDVAEVIGRDRFLTEIKTTATLNHPNILPLHDSGEADGFLFYVMPYVDGESLRDRIDRDRELPIDDAIGIASDVAAGLDSAHGQGIVHRDIKPDNILLREGRALIADFGIAFALESTETGRQTEAGITLGTPLYMSPEQITGDRPVGPPSDLFSLGCVLYEMLVGVPPHAGPGTQAIIAQILTGEPRSPLENRATVPANVDRATRRAMERIPGDRFASGREFAAALTDPTGAIDVRGLGFSGVPRRNALRIAAVAVAGAAVAAIAWGTTRSDPEAAGPVVRYTLALPEGEELLPSFGNSLALSPDGNTLVYVGPATAGQRLWARDRDQLHARALPGTEGARNAFFSPDGSRLGFTTLDGTLEITSLAGDPPLVLVDSDVLGRGGAWAEDGYIYFTQASTRGLARVAGTGGRSPEPVTSEDLGPEVLSHAWPHLLPDGRGLLFTIRRNHVEDDVAVLDFRTGEQRLLRVGSFAVYAMTGHLVLVERDGSLLAVPFDLSSLEAGGQPTVMGELPQGASPDLALSPTGRLAYATRAPVIDRVVWVARDGRETTIDPENPILGIRFLALSPDETRLALNTGALPADDGQMFIKELPDGPLSRLSFEGDVNFRPEWLQDSRTITYISDRGENRDVWMQAVDGSQPARVVLDDEAVVDEAAFSPDGGRLVYRRGMENGGRDLYVIRPGIEELGQPLIDTRFDVFAPTISPDGNWIAYVGEEDDQPNVYVRPFPAADRQWRVSKDGGVGPVWSRDSGELFFVNDDDVMVAVAYQGGESFSFGDEEVLFSTANYETEYYHRSYDVTADGQNFVMIRVWEREPGMDDLVIVENWFRELRDAVPSSR